MNTPFETDCSTRKLRRLVRDVYAKAADRVQVRLANGTTVSSGIVKRHRGSMQGDCLSPLIFLVVLAAVLDECDPDTTVEGNGTRGIRIGSLTLSRLEYADDMVFMVDVFQHLGERLQEVADQAKELADLGLHFKKTGIMHVRPTQAVTKETAEDRERIDCPHVCELCADVPALRPSFPTREGLRSHQSSAACCDRRSSFLGQTGFTDIVSPGGETVIDTTDPEWTVEKLVTCRGGGQVDGVQYERYWLVRWADWSVKPQGVEHAATQKQDGCVGRVGRNWYWVREQDLMVSESMKNKWFEEWFAPHWRSNFPKNPRFAAAYATEKVWLEDIKGRHITDVTFRRIGYGYRNGRYYCQPHLHRDDHAEHRCGLCNAMFFGGRGGASLKAHKSKAVRLGGCPGAPSLTGSGLKSEAVKKLKRKELEDLMPKVSIDPTNWEGVTEEDRAALDSAGHLELQNEYGTR